MKVKQLYQHAPFIFYPRDFNLGCSRDYIETICQDGDGAYLITAVVEEVNTKGEIERKRVIHEESIAFDYRTFITHNGLLNEDLKIYLN